MEGDPLNRTFESTEMMGLPQLLRRKFLYLHRFQLGGACLRWQWFQQQWFQQQQFLQYFFFILMQR